MYTSKKKKVHEHIWYTNPAQRDPQATKRPGEASDGNSSGMPLELFSCLMSASPRTQILVPTTNWQEPKLPWKTQANSGDGNPLGH